jgi:hypothetical protein
MRDSGVARSADLSLDRYEESGLRQDDPGSTASSTPTSLAMHDRIRAGHHSCVETGSRSTFSAPRRARPEEARTAVLIGLAKELRPDHLDFWTFQSNTAARRFYERHGFVATDTTDGENEERAPDVHYRWSNPELLH